MTELACVCEVMAVASRGNIGVSTVSLTTWSCKSFGANCLVTVTSRFLCNLIGPNATSDAGVDAKVDVLDSS